MILQSKGKDFKGAWVPYWQYDAVCLDDETAGKVAAQFEVKLLEVQWRGKDAGRACQIVVPSIGSNWFDVKELDVRVKSVHGQSGAACAECQTWRWLPLDFSEAPPVVADPKSWAPYDVVASPEWFGDGWQAFRQILYKRELAELIASASPRDFRVGTVEVSTR